MLAIISLLVVVTISILITRVATIALTHTGLSSEAARFQARSAFTGAGFTTGESEKVVSHPVRRRIILLLMLLGNAGIVTAVSSLILTFVGQGGGFSLTVKVLVLVTGLVALWAVASSRWVDRHLQSLIDRGLKRYTRLDVRDYASLMRLAGDYRLVELAVEPGDWLADRTLADAELRDEGVLVLGIKRADGKYLGAPDGTTRIDSSDTLVLYGRVDALEALDRRQKDYPGDRAHAEAVAEQARVADREKRIDEAGTADS